jgi:choline dehydrogenase
MQHVLRTFASRHVDEATGFIEPLRECRKRARSFSNVRFSPGRDRHVLPVAIESDPRVLGLSFACTGCGLSDEIPTIAVNEFIGGDMFDEIIVGAGSAGAIIAARLSEDTSRSVLLVEAGPDYPNINVTPGSILNGKRLAVDHDWGFSAEMVEGRSIEYPRGKLVGGSSAVNACLALRGVPSDYDEWSDLGNTDWSWRTVEPVFRAIEHDMDVVDSHHGQNGRIEVRRYRRENLTPAQAAFYQACTDAGFPETADHNHPDSTGVGTGPWNVTADGVRISTAVGYLQPARGRKNLTILSKTLVDRVIIENGRATGVEIAGSHGRERITGHRVTLSAGAVGTPTILLRSGIGNALDLRALGIVPQAALPGVGQNLIDHAHVGIGWFAPAGIVETDSPYIQTVLRFTAPDSSQPNDMQTILFQTLPQPALRLRALLVKPKSRGSLTLRSADPGVAPLIRLNLLSAPEDKRRMMAGVRLLGQFIANPRMISIGASRLVLEGPATHEASDVQKWLANDDWVGTYAHSTVRHYVHPVGTARMGPERDPGAVVDQRGRVHGISRLRVADASVMPTIPRANTNFPCMMIGERMAAWMALEAD